MYIYAGKFNDCATGIKVLKLDLAFCITIKSIAITAACKECGTPALITPIRGGTDGARLSFMGLPCPNLGTGGHAFHGPYEHITVEGMDIAVEVGLKIIELFYK